MKAIFDPDEIALKKFVIRWRGYDTREVETFLRAVAVDVRRLMDRVAVADQPASTGDELVEVQDELNRLSSRLDYALAGLEAAGLTEPAGPSEPGASTETASPSERAAATDHGAPSHEPADLTDPTWKPDPRLLCNASGRG